MWLFNFPHCQQYFEDNLPKDLTQKTWIIKSSAYIFGALINKQKSRWSMKLIVEISAFTAYFYFYSLFFFLTFTNTKVILLLHTVHVCEWIYRAVPTLFTSSWTIKDKAEQTIVTHMFSLLLGLLWSYDFSWSSPLVHSKWWNHTICFQGNMLTTDKHSSNCGGNTFFPFQAAVCVFVRQEPPTTVNVVQLWRAPSLAALPLEGTALSAFTYWALCQQTLLPQTSRDKWPVRLSFIFILHEYYTN